ncbi:MAG: hypothetical protein Q4E06_03080 [Lautropia sp.]|nr:hypothetical protein [Lautropia sp.]
MSRAGNERIRPDTILMQTSDGDDSSDASYRRSGNVNINDNNRTMILPRWQHTDETAFAGAAPSVIKPSSDHHQVVTSDSSDAILSRHVGHGHHRP